MAEEIRAGKAIAFSLKVESLFSKALKANAPQAEGACTTEVPKLMQGANKNHAALQGLKKFPPSNHGHE